MSINIIGMPINHGTDKKGSNHGPDKYRELNIQSNLEKLGYEVKDLGNIEVADVTDEHMYRFHEKLRYYDVVIDANTKLAFKAYDSISNGNFPLILGGDHSLGMGSIAGVSKVVKNLGVVWIDAHGDLNTHESTITGNIHGMPLAVSMGKGPDKLVNLFEHRVKIKDENVVLIGARDLDPGEIEIIENSNMKSFSMKRVQEVGIDKVIEESLEYLRNKVDGIHISFDIDSIDPAFVPGTGTPVKDGLSIEEARKLLNAFATSGMMVSLDFVELNPALDKNDVTANLAMDLLMDIFKHLDKNSISQVAITDEN